MKEVNLFFTDLDSTILDENYNLKLSAVKCIYAAYLKNFVIIFASSKTLPEQQYFAKKLGIPVTYIVENGAAIYISENVFENTLQKNGCRKIVLSRFSISYVRSVLFKLAANNPAMKFYGNATLREVSRYTGLPIYLARLAKKREYTETIFDGYTDEVEKKLIEHRVFPQKGSRFITVGDKTNKGESARKLISFLREIGYTIKRTIGIGDGPNDIPLLKVVSEPYIIGEKIHIKNVPNINKLTEIEL